MAKRIDDPVTLSHDDANTVRELLHDYARGNYSHAKKTSSAAVRDICIASAAKADRLCEVITRSLWTWSDDK